MDEETYTSYFNNLPGYERYECPDCKGDGPNATQTWRSLDRLVSKIQHRRAQFAPKKVPKEEVDHGVLAHGRRKASMARWVRERAAMGATWAAEARGGGSLHGAAPSQPQALPSSPATPAPRALDLTALAAADGAGGANTDRLNDADSYDGLSSDAETVDMEVDEPGHVDTPDAAGHVAAAAGEHGTLPATRDETEETIPVDGSSAPADDGASAELAAIGSESEGAVAPGAREAPIGGAPSDRAADVALKADAPPGSPGEIARDCARSRESSDEVSAGVAGPAAADAHEGGLDSRALALTNGDGREGGAASPSARAELAVAEPDDDRTCAYCHYGPDPECGRMLPAGADGWVHANCATWSSEVYEKEPGVLRHVAASIRRSRKSACEGCGLLGASVGCNAKRCTSSYHFMCARAAGVTYTHSTEDGRLVT